jgi:hypothetical protein
MSIPGNIDSLNPTPVALISAADKVAFYNTADGNTYSISLAQLQDYVLAGGTIDPVFDDLTCATLDVTGTTTLRGAVSFLADATHDIGAVASARPRNVYTSADVFAAGVRVGRGAGAVASNTVAGAGALNANTTGLANTAFGGQALAANIAGNFSTAIGYQALLVNTAGDSTAVGYAALAASTTSTQNTAVGRAALLNATTGGFNTAVGRSAMQNNTTGSDNVAVGVSAMSANVDATLCTAVGNNALQSNASATGSATAIGYAALQLLNGGNACTAVGVSALGVATTGNDNTAVGRSAGVAVTTGASNTIMGRSAANTLTTGSRNTIIGNASNASAVGGIDQTVIGQGLTGKGDDTAFIGGTNGAYNEKNVVTWEVTSDERLKRDIVDNHDGLDKINAIRVRNFTYRAPSEVLELPASAAIDKPGVQLGVIAQEMLPECVSETSDGVKSVSTDAVLWYLVNAVQQLHATVETLKQELGR